MGRSACSPVTGSPIDVARQPPQAERPHNPCREAVQERVVRQIRTLRAMRRELETESRMLLHGHEGETLETAKETPTGHRASSRPYQGAAVVCC